MLQTITTWKIPQITGYGRECMLAEEILHWFKKSHFHHCKYFVKKKSKTKSKSFDKCYILKSSFSSVSKPAPSLVRLLLYLHSIKYNAGSFYTQGHSNRSTTRSGKVKYFIRSITQPSKSAFLQIFTRNSSKQPPYSTPRIFTDYAVNWRIQLEH